MDLLVISLASAARALVASILKPEWERVKRGD